MGILSNNAFSRSLMIRLSESFSEINLPYANEISQEKVVQILRTETFLKIDDIRFSLDSIQEKGEKTIINGSHVLGMGFTIRIVPISEYESKIQLIFCDKELNRLEKIEKDFISQLKKKEGIH
jgi:hypothetical protein